MSHLIDRRNLGLKFAICFFFYVLLIILRIYIEAGVLASFFKYHVVFHHIFWFVSVLFWFMIALRYVAKVPKHVLVLLPLSAVIVFIPMLYAWIDSGRASLIYIRSRNITDILSYIGTLMYTHEKNHYMFPELLLLEVGITAISWYYSRSVIRTILTVIVGFYIGMLTGFHWIGVAPNSKAYFPIVTGFKNHVLMSLFYYMVAFIFVCILYFPEISLLVKKHVSRKYIILSVLVSLIVLIPLSYITEQLAIFDYVLMFFPPFLFMINILLLQNSSISRGVKIVSSWFVISGLLILVPPHVLKF